jgi:rhomboid protease GluP
VLLLIGINTAVFFFLPIAFPSRYPYRLETLGAAWGPLVFSGEWWRVLTCSFVHFELSHLLPNMIGLWILGSRMERELGKWTFLFFYLVCGVVVALSVLALNPFTAFVGASGPVAGLAGAIVAIYIPRFSALSWRTRGKLGLLILVVAGLVAREFTRGGLYLAHTTGLITGAFLCVLLVSVAKTTRAKFYTFVGLIPLLVIGAMLVQRYHG